MHTNLLKNCRILIAEDDALTGVDLAGALQSVGATVIGPLATVKDSLDFANSGDYDIAILDIGLQDGEAYAVGEAIRQRGKPLVFATGTKRERIPNEFQDIPHWLKPFSPQQLAKTIAVAWQSRDAEGFA